MLVWDSGHATGADRKTRVMYPFSCITITETQALASRIMELGSGWANL